MGKEPKDQGFPPFLRHSLEVLPSSSLALIFTSGWGTPTPNWPPDNTRAPGYNIRWCRSGSWAEVTIS